LFHKFAHRRNINMKTFALASLIVPATAFVPGIGMQCRGVAIATPSRPQQQLHYYRSSPNRNDNDSSFEDLRRQFTTPPEPSTDQVKQVVGRTFRFFQTLNREASSSTTERSRNEEILGKLQKWIERTIEFSDELSKDFPDQEGPVATAVSTTSNDDAVPLGVSANAAADSTFESRTTADAFEVQLDVPGVELADLDIRLDETLKIVTVLGQRGGRSFSRGVDLDAEADIRHLSATLKNGVLTLRAPKVKPPTNNLKRIPVIVEDA
jgi:HSP20 family molecular chaperone IbpA